MSKHSQARHLLQKNKLKEAITHLKQFYGDQLVQDELDQQAGRLASVKQDFRVGIVPVEKLNTVENQIRIALLELLRELEGDEEKDKLREEEEKNHNTKEEKQHTGEIINQTAEKIFNIDKIENANFE